MGDRCIDELKFGNPITDARRAERAAIAARLNAIIVTAEHKLVDFNDSIAVAVGRAFADLLDALIALADELEKGK